MDERIRRSRAQEKRFARSHGGRVQPGSGNGAFRKGDVRSDDTLYECKRTDKQQMVLKADWLEDIRKHALIDGRIPALGIEISGRRWVLLPEDDYRDLTNREE